MTKNPIDLERLKKDISLLKFLAEDNVSVTLHPNDFPVLVKQGEELISTLEEAKEIIKESHRIKQYMMEGRVKETRWLSRFKKDENE